MNKEKAAYIKHIMSSRFVQIDIINVMLSMAIIIISFFAFFSGNASMFGVSFLIGAVLALFNMIKSFMKKSPMGAFVFGVIIPALSFAAFFIFRYIAV